VIVRLEEVSKHYGKGDSLIRAVDQVSLHLQEGGFVILMGPSGSGKTTLLNLIGGMTRPDNGRIEVAGADMLSMPDRELSLLRARKMGFAFQFQGMLPTLTALENLMLPMHFSGMGINPRRARRLLEEVGLGGRMGAYAQELSAGQQRRVCMARALVNEPALLLCDEPTGDLDPENEDVIMAMIKEANRGGASVIMTTHNSSLRSHAKRSMWIKDGRIVKGE